MRGLRTRRPSFRAEGEAIQQCRSVGMDCFATALLAMTSEAIDTARAAETYAFSASASASTPSIGACIRSHEMTSPAGVRRPPGADHRADIGRRNVDDPGLAHQLQSEPDRNRMHRVHGRLDLRLDERQRDGLLSCAREKVPLEGLKMARAPVQHPAFVEVEQPHDAPDQGGSSRRRLAGPCAIR